MSLIANTFRVALCGALPALAQASELPWCMLPTPDWVVLADCVRQGGVNNLA